MYHLNKRIFPDDLKVVRVTIFKEGDRSEL